MSRSTVVFVSLFLTLAGGFLGWTLRSIKCEVDSLHDRRVTDCLAKCQKWPDCGFDPDTCWRLP